ncbi:hypothetical protein DACRYDRAFT_104944 [Dacryopinax primogenitus]|uniref:Uncharacterized protein n=1 Tax=Dacryopinax primogenitus (strain DJM 731) TaxID=1858805 RepID=M5G464_DACPD|nr:uncharacterized protein DACRYDRAFT_104944 [Dacryopinax primogenitus]EJU05056.1 hypothetical protein DACRYDRAFT_104944 [Dacryopinax primogenitus]
MAGNTRSTPDDVLPRRPSSISHIQQFLRKRFSLKEDFPVRTRRASGLTEHFNFFRSRGPSKTAPSAMETVASMSPITPSSPMTAADISLRRRSVSFAPKTPSRLAQSMLPLSPPITPNKESFSDAQVDDRISIELPHHATALSNAPRPLSFAASSLKRGRKPPPAALDLSPRKVLTPATRTKQDVAEKKKPGRLNVKILESIARRGGQVPPAAVADQNALSATSPPNMRPVGTPKEEFGAQIGMLGLGMVASPLPLSALSPRPPAARSGTANVSHGQASAAAPITAIHMGRQMTFAPLPPEPDELGRCTLIDEEGEPSMVFPREIQDWIYMPWVYWGMICGRPFNLWFEPRK